MSLIFPKKEILYAPMLGTLGGGSARGFGRGAGGEVPPGEVIFKPSSNGSAYTWTVPEGVTYISMVAIGGGGAGAVGNAGGAGGGGGLAYINNMAVSAGQTFQVVSGRGGIRARTGWEGTNTETPFYQGYAGVDSSVYSNQLGVDIMAAYGGGLGTNAGTYSHGSPAAGGPGGGYNIHNVFIANSASSTYGGGVGGAGGTDNNNNGSPGGGGAGGYGGNGGNGGGTSGGGQAGSAGGISAGGGGGMVAPNSYVGGMNGGGVGIFGASTVAGQAGADYLSTGNGTQDPDNTYTATADNNSVSSPSGSTWEPRTNFGTTRWCHTHYGHDSTPDTVGIRSHHPPSSSYSDTRMGFGGGGGGSNDGSPAGSGASGVVRILWGGKAYETTRTFPSTNVQRSNQLDPNGTVEIIYS